jgi:hypothetical protein
MEESPNKEPKPSRLDKFLDYIADRFVPMNFVIKNIDTPMEETNGLSDYR